MIGRKLWLLLTLLALLCTPFILAEDAADGEVTDDDKEIEEGNVKVTEESSVENKKDDSSGIGPSPDAQVTVFFTTPVNSRDLTANQIVKLLIGFANKGEKDFIVKASETSFRYSMDFSYHLQNFSEVQYNQVVQPKKEATFAYSFIPSDAFIGRSLGLTVNLHYTDVDGTFYVNAAYNETVNIVEDESGFNTETGFLYVMLAGFSVLILLLGQHFLSKFTKKQSSNYQPVQETGTSSNDVDYEWIPRTNFLEKKSPKVRRPAKAN